MLRVDGEHYLIVVQVDRLHVGERERPYQTYLHLVRLQHRQHLLGAAGADRNIDALVLAAEGVQDTGQDVGADREGGAQVQRTELYVAHLVDGLTPLHQGLQDPLRVGEEGETGIGQPHPAAAALEQLLAHLTL